MNLERLYPSPPHLTVTAWAPGPEQATFAAMCRAVEAAGGIATGVVATGEVGVRFGSLGDLAELQNLNWVQPWRPGERLAALIDGTDPTDRAVKAGYLAGRQSNGEEDRLVVVEFDPAQPDESHPVMAAMYSDILGIPEDCWEDGDAARAEEISTWILGLFSDAQQRTGSLYGSIEVERELPSPALLRESRGLSGVLYLASALTDAIPDLLDGVRELNPGAEETVWPTGRFFCSWAPLRRDGQETVPLEHELDRACGILIGDAVERYLEL